MNIVMLGPPGAGKDEQCSRLAKRLHVPHLAIGRILRDEIRRQTSLAAAIHSRTSKGENVGVLAFDLLRPSIEQARNGFVLDDFPRDFAQLAAWEHHLSETHLRLDLVFFLNVSKPTSLARLIRRAQERQYDGKEREQREDEKPEVIEKRYDVGYAPYAEEILRYHEEHFPFAVIDGEPSISVVERAVWEAVERLHAKQ